MVTIGERRVTSAGNVYELVRADGEWRSVKRVAKADGGPCWDAGMVYRWHSSQWEEGLPLVDGPTEGYPHFGVFMPAR